MRYQSDDTLILPPEQVHQIFAEIESEFVSAMPIGGTVKLPDGMVIDLPWRKLRSLHNKSIQPMVSPPLRCGKPAAELWRSTDEVGSDR